MEGRGEHSRFKNVRIGIRQREREWKLHRPRGWDQIEDSEIERVSLFLDLDLTCQIYLSKRIV